jgi:hypothetical protein
MVQMSPATDSTVVAPLTAPAAPPDASSQHFIAVPHVLPGVTAEPQRRPSDPGWAFVLFCGVLLAMGYMRWSLSKRFDQFLRGFYDSNMATQLFLEDNSVTQRLTAFFLIGGLVNVALLAADAMQRSAHLGEGAGTIALMLFVAIGLGLAFKSWLNNVMGWLYGAERPFAQHNFNHLLFFGTLAPLLAPLVLVVYFGPADAARACLMAGAAVTLLCYLVLQWRGAMLFLRQPGVNMLHLVYYLCAFELAPLSLAIRLAGRYT